MITQLGRYKLTKLIATGGMAKVFHCEDTKGEFKSLAAKIPLDFVLAQPQYLKRFQNEAKISLKFKHPNIITMFDAGTFDGTPYMVMEFIDGKALEDVQEARGVFELKEAVSIIKDLCRAIAYMHNYRDEDIQSSIVHRDLSPQNVVIQKDGRVVLMDFGIAKSASLTSVTMGTATIGKPYYMAPEQIQAKDSSAIDKRADIYAVGVMLYEMVTGKKPYEGANPFQVMEKVRNPKMMPKAPHEINPAVPKGISDIIMRAMHKSRAQRFQRIEEMLAALEKGEDISEAKRTTRLLAAMVTISILMIGTGVFGLFYTHKKERERLRGMNLSAPLPELTRSSRISFSGETLPDHRVRLSMGPKAVEATTGKKGIFSFEDLGLEQGDNAIRLALVDDGGNTVASKSSVFTKCDAVAPDPPVVSPMPPLVPAGPVSISGRAEPDAEIIFLGAGSEEKPLTCPVGRDGTFRFDGLILPEGPVKLELVCRDPAGNTSEAASIDLIGDSTPPPVPDFFDIPGTMKSCRTPIFGRTEPFGRVRAVWDGTGCTCEADSTGLFLIEGFSIQENPVKIEAHAIDRTGNSQKTAKTVEISPDPDAFGISPDLPSWIFRDSDILLTGMSPGDEIKAELDSKTVVSPVTGGGFAIPLVLEPGRNKIVLRAYSSGTEVARTPVLCATLDQEKPSLPIIFPDQAIFREGPAAISGIAEPYCRVTATGSLGEGTATVSPNGTFTLQGLPLSEEPSSFTVAVEDRAGNTSDPVTVVLALDNRPPAVEIKGLGQTLNSEILTLRGKTEPDSSVFLQIDSRNYWTRSGSSGEFAFPQVRLFESENRFSVFAVDKAGNQTPPEEPRTLMVDVVPPQRPSVQKLPGNLTKDRSVTVAGQAEAGSTIRIVVRCPGKEGLSDYRTVTAPVDAVGRFEFADLKLNVGINNIHVVCLDAAGNESPSAPVQTVSVDLSLPPAPVFVNLPEQTCRRELTVSAAGLPDSKLKLRTGGNDFDGTTDAAGKGTIGPVSLVEGKNRLELIAVDSTGLESPETFAEILVDLVKPSAPILENLPKVVDKPSLTIDGTAEENSFIVLDINGVTYETAADGTGIFKFLGVTLAEGPNRIEALSRDPAGNLSDLGVVNTVTLDTQPPDPPRIMGLPESVDAASLTVSGMAEPGAKVIILANQERFEATVNQSGNFSTIVQLKEGNNIITATARDEVGNESELSQAIRVTCSIPPDPPVLTGLPESVPSESLTVSGLAEAGSKVIVKIGEKAFETQCPGGQFSVGVTLIYGENIITAEAIDGLGNVSRPSRGHKIYFEKVAWARVDSVPAGAKFTANGKELGVTPIEKAKIEPGEVTFSISRLGYRTKTWKASVSVGENLEFNHSLDQLMLPLTIDSNPPGADLHLDGNMMGRTPYTASALPAGTHQVMIRLANHHDLSERIELTEGGKTDFTFKLKPVMGYLRIKCNVMAAAVVVNNQAMGETPIEPLPLPYGEHMVVIQKPKHAPFKRKISIDSPVEVELDATLKRQEYKIDVQCAESGAKIYLNGKYIGKTPVEPIDVPDPGEYALTVEKEGFAPYKGKVDVFETGVTPRDVRLYPQKQVIVERSRSGDEKLTKVAYDDGNNSFWLAKPIGMAQDFSNVLELSKGDSEDWWKISFDGSGYFYATLHGKVSMKLYRDDPSNEIVVSGSTASRIQMDTGQILYIRIQGKGTSDETYKLVTSFRSHSTGDGF